jgi:hypothetical protein
MENKDCDPCGIDELMVVYSRPLNLWFSECNIHGRGRPVSQFLAGKETCSSPFLFPVGWRVAPNPGGNKKEESLFSFCPLCACQGFSFNEDSLLPNVDTFHIDYHFLDLQLLQSFSDKCGLRTALL